MNDPWDVKSVLQFGQYISCLKINGVPLLPPVLSKECRKEMQYYKILAKEVEKRISLLKSCVGDSDEDTQDKTDATELPQEFVQACEPLIDVLNDNLSEFKESVNESSPECTKPNSPDLYDSASTNSHISHSWPSSNFNVNFSMVQKETEKCITNNVNDPQHTPQPLEPPERDYNSSPEKKSPNKKEKELLTDTEISYKYKKSIKDKEELSSIEFDIIKVEPLSDPLPDMPMVDGPPSLGSKSFTGSLNNIHRECFKESSGLLRQSSYTVLNPSPQLLEHLKVQSLSTGIDMSSFSMSDSISHLITPRKRRSWDLESAKMKWSCMAHELKQKTTIKTKLNDVHRNPSTTSNKKTQHNLLPRNNSLQEQPRQASVPGKTFPKSDPIQKLKTSPGQNKNISNFTKTETTGKPANQKSNQPKGHLISKSEDPATKVKELYEKIQNQQLLQMANLVEKQKREQMLLQQVFEEQNSILARQLKIICPKSPVEAKAAWADKSPQNNDKGPVSLSQLIHHKSPEIESSLSSTLSDTHNNLCKIANVLRMSRDINGSLNKQRAKLSPNKARSSDVGSLTRTHSPVRLQGNTSRKLSYDTSASSDREFEPVMTDRTNDTLAGLNVTFTSDSDDCQTNTSKRWQPEPRPAASASPNADVSARHPARAAPARRPQAKLPPTPEKQAAAAVIVAYAKGYLVRRLLRTARVQATVQTIKDALLCALQLHQDRAGIRGADVDLHRRLIQQITAACYSLHDTFIASTPVERCALIAADRERLLRPAALHRRQSDIMSQSHSGAFPARASRSSGSHTLMTQSNYETYSNSKMGSRSYLPSPQRRPWR